MQDLPNVPPNIPGSISAYEQQNVWRKYGRGGKVAHTNHSHNGEELRSRCFSSTAVLPSPAEDVAERPTALELVCDH